MPGIGLGVSLGGGGSGSGGVAARTAMVPGAQTGTVFVLVHTLGADSVFTLIAGTNANLTVSGLNIIAASQLNVASQVAVVREANGQLAIEYPLTLTGFLALQISGTAADTATLGAPYSFVPNTIGGVGIKNFTLTGSLLAGFSFDNTTGAVTAVNPTQPGSMILTITVSDNSGTVSLAPFTITISAIRTGTLDFSDPNQSGFIL